MIACPVCLTVPTPVLNALSYVCSCQRLTFMITPAFPGVTWTFTMDRQAYLSINERGRLVMWDGSGPVAVSPEDAERTVSHAVRVAKIAEVMES